MELHHIKGNTYYLENRTNIGLYRLQDNDVCIIDSGNDNTAGKRILRQIDENGQHLSAIYITHAHADHIGGNAFCSNTPTVRFFAGALSACGMEHTLWEPSLLYGGYPPKNLRHKFILAAPSNARRLTQDCLPEGWQTVSLAGHSPDMIGYITPDGVAFIGDCVCSPVTLEKYKIPYNYNIAQTLATLSDLRSLSADIFVPSHAPITDDITELIDRNETAIYSVCDDIVSLCQTPKSFEVLLSELFTRYTLMMTVEQYALVGSTVRSYLSYLQDEGRLAVSVENSFVVWNAKA